MNREPWATAFSTPSAKTLPSACFSWSLIQLPSDSRTGSPDRCAKGISYSPENLSPPGYAWFYLPILLLVLRLNDTHQSADLRSRKRNWPSVSVPSPFRLSSWCAQTSSFFKGTWLFALSVRGLVLLALAFVPAFRLGGLKGVYGASGGAAGAEKPFGWAAQRSLPNLRVRFLSQRHRGYQMVGVVPAPESAAADTHSLIDCASYDSRSRSTIFGDCVPN